MVMKDLNNKRFGYVTVLYKFGYNENNQIIWLCKCDCGREFTRLAKDINRRTSTCGCSLRYLKHYKVMKKNDERNSGFISLFNNYISGARRRNIPFELSKDDFYSIVTKPCFYCGIDPKQETILSDRKTIFIYNGVDRVNNDREYSLDNCVPCCKMCNRAKYVYSKEEFLTWVKRLYIHNFSE